VSAGQAGIGPRDPKIGWVRVSVLDQSPIPEGESGAQALRNTLDLASLADRLGYHRYWVAEHHGGPMLAGPSPEALIGPIAAATAAIRVGSGGVMLPHYSPLKVAETFSLLAGLYPERIDLGLGRAAGTDPLTTYALQRDRRQASPDDFPDQLVELLAYLDGTLPADHPFARLQHHLPGMPERPEPWLLGSSPQSAVWAAQLGLPYAFADFISPGNGEIARSYRERFEDAGRGRAAETGARVAVGVWALCADDDQQARWLASSSRMAMRMLRMGRLIPVPTPERAVDWLRAQGEWPGGGFTAGRRGIVGSPSTVRDGLLGVAREYGAEELIVVTICHDHAARRRSYELIAEVMELEPRDPAPEDSTALQRT
jgi:luciferase family oxidoreductase group 1